MKKHDDLKELHLSEIDRRLRELELLNSIINELESAIMETAANDKMV